MPRSGPERARRLPAQEEVAADGHLLDEGGVLVDGLDAGVDRVARAPETDGPALEADLAGARAERP